MVTGRAVLCDNIIISASGLLIAKSSKQDDVNSAAVLCVRRSCYGSIFVKPLSLSLAPLSSVETWCCCCGFPYTLPPQHVPIHSITAHFIYNIRIWFWGSKIKIIHKREKVFRANSNYTSCCICVHFGHFWRYQFINHQSHHFVVVEQFVNLFWVLNSPRAKYILITSFGHDF